jgi:Zn finger protein HypA/HybF involved in hydrogenase expression
VALALSEQPQVTHILINQSCGAEIELEEIFDLCSCGSNQITCIAGEELKIKEIEVY